MQIRKNSGLAIKRPPVIKSLSTLLILAVVAGTILALSRPASEVHAVTPPDSCFAFNSGSGTITDYYDNEGNNGANPACPRSVDIPSTIGGVAVTSIADYAFYDKQLTSVTIPSGVTTIGVWAFNYNQMTSVSIPSTAVNIANGAFGRNLLTSVTIPAGVTIIDTDVFYNNQLTSITIPAGVTSIGSSAFADNQLTTVTIPDSVTSIAGAAFSDNQLTTITIPDSVINIGGSAFFDNQLISVTLPEGIVSIGNDAFGKNPLTSLSLPDSISSEFDLSYGKLATLKLPSSLTSLTSWNYAYNSLTRLTIPSGVTEIDPDTFFAQTPWGVDIENSSIPGTYIYNDNPAIVQYVYDNIWYMRAYTANATNSHNLSDASVSEWWASGDDNQNGTLTDSLGGHIINPASTVVRYRDTNGNAVAPEVTVTGIKIGETPSSALDSSDYLHTYLVSESAVPTPLNPYNPTSPELSAMELGFSQYYRIRDEVTFAPKNIAGYNTPSTQTVSLNEEDNVVTFIYSPAITSVSFATNTVTNGELTSGTPPSGTSAPLLANSILSLDAGDCSTIQSANLLAPSSITANNLPSEVNLVGGLDFSLSCTTGGETGIDFTLGNNVTNTSKIKVYKYNTTSHELTDITHLVTFSNQDVNGELKTVISYSLTDGGQLDEDGTANGTILDPIVIGYAGDLSELSGGSSLANTGMSLWILVMAPIGAIILGIGLLTKKSK